MDETIEILIERDSITPDQARKLINETIDEITEAMAYGGSEEAEQIWQDHIGLEPDYMVACLI
jgi:anionic cell wall polymer biosynthesis LytR-Cps2A-Psr (LCP) family protein